MSQDGVNFVFAATICRDEGIDISTTGLEYIVAVRVTTNHLLTNTPDGYDLDGIESLHPCDDVPEPVIIPGDCYASELVEYVEGITSDGGSIDAVRTDPTEALGEPERTDSYVFTTLGYGGSLTLGFNGAVPNGEGDDIEVVETSFNTPDCATYPEFADIYLSQDGENFLYATTICKGNAFIDIDDANPDWEFITYVKIVNNNELTTTPDGYDVDGVVAFYNCDDEDKHNADAKPTDPFASMGGLLKSQPNPATNNSMVTFSPAYSGYTNLEVYDMSGRHIETLFSRSADENVDYKINFNVDNLPNGLYMYRLTTNHEVLISKFMVVH
ncbi:MAG: T9SS type A sorting domain-containing protein [Flavobacteriales bacterium]|nr:T9SS type A sorting domain-containing protein [Flavobacteriales bacterium]